MLGRCKQLMVSLLFRGAKRLVSLLPGWLLRFRPFGVYEIRLADGWVTTRESVGPTPPNASLRVAWVSEREQLAELTDVAGTENLRAWHPATRRLAVAWLDEQPVAAAWIASELFAEPELGLCYQLQTDEVWLFAAVVAPEHRRQGIYARLLGFVLDELAEEDRSRMLLGISTGNEASLAAHSKFGAQQIGSIVAARSLGLGFCQTSGEIYRQSRPMSWGQHFLLRTSRENA